jgi:hypothetical protein
VTARASRGQLTVLVASLFATLVSTAGWADEQEAAEDPPAEFEARQTRSGTQGTLRLGPHHSETGSDGATPARSVPWVAVPRLGSYVNEEGEVVYCRATRWAPALDDRDRQVRNANAAFQGLFTGLPELHGYDPNHSCPIDPTDPLPPSLVRDVVIRTVEDQLPRPTLEVPPGYALTGMPAYLVTNHTLDYGPVTHDVDLGIMTLQVTVTATGTTQVDWGDGHVETYHAPGTPWPHGQVHHTYIDTGTVTITATDTWQVTYEVPELDIVDTVTAPLAPRTLDGFEIQQLQAVRVAD